MTDDVKQAALDRMRGDATLLGLLTGGIYGGANITPQMPEPAPFDEFGRMRPSALVRHEVSATTGPGRRFTRQFLVVFFYDSAGYETIRAAMERTQTLLHEYRVGGGAFQLWHVDTVDDQYDDALVAYMHRARFEAMRRLGG
jgi:hypothetical protein